MNPVQTLQVRGEPSEIPNGIRGFRRTAGNGRHDGCNCQDGSEQQRNQNAAHSPLLPAKLRIAPILPRNNAVQQPEFSRRPGLSHLEFQAIFVFVENVIPAKAGIQWPEILRNQARPSPGTALCTVLNQTFNALDSRFRGNDEPGEVKCDSPVATPRTIAKSRTIRWW